MDADILLKQAVTRVKPGTKSAASRTKEADVSSLLAKYKSDAKSRRAQSPKRKSPQGPRTSLKLALQCDRTLPMPSSSHPSSESESTSATAERDAFGSPTGSSNSAPPSSIPRSLSPAKRASSPPPESKHRPVSPTPSIHSKHRSVSPTTSMQIAASRTPPKLPERTSNSPTAVFDLTSSSEARSRTASLGQSRPSLPPAPRRLPLPQPVCTSSSTPAPASRDSPDPLGNNVSPTQPSHRDAPYLAGTGAFRGHSSSSSSNSIVSNSVSSVDVGAHGNHVSRTSGLGGYGSAGPPLKGLSWLGGSACAG
eukprot:Rmarinus@m.19134